MSDSNMKILLVDDDPALIEMHSALLEYNHYSVLVAEDGARAMQMLDNFPENIGVVVTDITMPNMDGYELCTLIKANDKTKNIPVIFVSALTGLEEKLKGYAVGADDYITKPVNEAELSRKICVLMEIRQKLDALSKQVMASQSMALQAMTFSSELGLVVEFYKNALNAASYQEIADRYFELLAAFNLVSILQIQTPKKVLNMSENGIVSPLEVNVIELARNKGRFFDFGARTMVNYPSFTILVKNMPLSDPEKYGRIKDILGMLGNGLDAKIHQLNTEALAKQKYSTVLSIKESISNIENLFADLQRENVSAIEDMNEQVSDAIMVLGLTEVQEHDIQQITRNCLERSNTAFYKGISIENNLKNIYQQFNYALGIKS